MFRRAYIPLEFECLGWMVYKDDETAQVALVFIKVCVCICDTENNLHVNLKGFGQLFFFLLFQKQGRSKNVDFRLRSPGLSIEIVRHPRSWQSRCFFFCLFV